MGANPYAAQLVRLINGDTCSAAANFKEVEIESPVNGKYEGRKQPIACGSCIVIENAQVLNSLDELTIATTLMPTAPTRGVQHLIAHWDARAQAGWSLHLNAKGQLSFVAADDRGVIRAAEIERPLSAEVLYSVALRVSWRTGTIRLECRAIDAALAESNVMSGQAIAEKSGARPAGAYPLLMAAAFGGHDVGGRVIPADCFDGRLEAPVIYQGILSDSELGKVMAGERPASLSARLAADWDFSDGISSTRIMDRSTHRLHGYIHTLPLRAVKGSRWSANTMEWPHAPEQYAAIHFHSDDLYDCGWLTDIAYQVPAALRSGIYALRLRLCAESGSVVDEEYLPFFVAPPRGLPQSKIAFMVPTHTYVAYGNIALGAGYMTSGLSAREYFASPTTGPGTMEYALTLAEHPELGGSVYERHLDGSPVHFSSWLRPLLNMRPKSVLWTLCADLLLIDWLEAKAFHHDIITDDLVHEEGADLLKSYDVIVTGNHQEYQTTQQLNAVESYLNQGGRLMYMGGNGFYWRTAVHPEIPGAIEVRRGRAGTGTGQSEVGESSLAFSGEVGGIWRELGRPPQRLCGVGFIAEGTGRSYYRILPEARRGRAAFILEGVDQDVIGDFGIFEGGAAGQEIDKTNASHGTPVDTIVLARSENHSSTMLYAIEEMRSIHPVIDSYRALTHAEVTYFETVLGGAVFSVGSMTWCGSLSHNGYNNNISTITENVLARFSRDAKVSVLRTLSR